MRQHYQSTTLKVLVLGSSERREGDTTCVAKVGFGQVFSVYIYCVRTFKTQVSHSEKMVAHTVFRTSSSKQWTDDHVQSHCQSIKKGVTTLNKQFSSLQMFVRTRRTKDVKWLGSNLVDTRYARARIICVCKSPSCPCLCVHTLISVKTPVIQT